jgi:hypothetical protein
MTQDGNGGGQTSLSEHLLLQVVETVQAEANGAKPRASSAANRRAFFTQSSFSSWR